MKALSILFLFFLSFNAWAQVEPDTDTVAGIGKIPYQELFVLASQPNQPKDEFLLVVASRLWAYSQSSGFEACGVLAHNGGIWSVVVGTNQSHVACVTTEDRIVRGSRFAGENIHSHGNTQTAHLNMIDRKILGLRATDRHRRLMIWQHTERFSHHDLNEGAGYLAISDGFLYHDGKNKIRSVRRGNQ